jgi:hypothetical protein
MVAQVRPGSDSVAVLARCRNQVCPKREGIVEVDLLDPLAGEEGARVGEPPAIVALAVWGEGAIANQPFDLFP